MPKYAKALAAFCIGLMAMFGYTGASRAQQNAITAIDIALEPDATMIQHAQADNARLLKAFPKGFALDASHHPHISMLQQFVRTADLDKVYTAANKVFASMQYSVTNTALPLITYNNTLTMQGITFQSLYQRMVHDPNGK